MRKETQTIFHLHGSWESPATCVLGIRDYEKTLSDTVRDLVQRSLASLKRLLFIGCSGTFADPNFSRLVAWLRKEIKTAAPEHFALVMDDEIDARNRDAAWQEFVEPLSYGNRRDRLAPFLLEIFSRSSSSDERQDQRLSTPVLPNSRRVEALPEYRDPPSDTLIDSDIETAHRGEAESSPPKPTDWYGFTIASPTEGASVGKTINLNGTYRKVPPDKRVVIIEYVPQDGDYWFKDGPIRFRRDNHWFARIDIGGTRKERVLQLAVLGPDGQALMDYYFQVASKNIWIGVKKLTADTVSCGEVTVIFRRR